MRLIKSEGIEVSYSNNIKVIEFKKIFHNITITKYLDEYLHLDALGKYLDHIPMYNIKNFSHVNVGDYNIFTICDKSSFVSTRISTDCMFSSNFPRIKSINITDINFLPDNRFTYHNFFLNFYRLLVHIILSIDYMHSQQPIKDLGTRIGEVLLDSVYNIEKYRIVADEKAETLLLILNYNTDPCILQIVFK